MGYSCRILADSISPLGVRLTTMEVTYPRIVHSEFMTYRVYSRNAGSNRAIPVRKLLTACFSDPFIPLSWPKEQKGMQGGDTLDEIRSTAAERIWLEARDRAVDAARRLSELGVHKSLPNRLLEPWQWITVIVSSTEWGNYYNQRIDGDAEQHIYRIAEMMWQTQEDSTPTYVPYGHWHLPLVNEQDRKEFTDYYALKKLSAGRCARVSYLTHQGERLPSEDFRLHDDLVRSGHWSPFEHQATPAATRGFRHDTGNFKGWTQYRKSFSNENRRIYIPQ